MMNAQNRAFFLLALIVPTLFLGCQRKTKALDVSPSTGTGAGTGLGAAGAADTNASFSSGGTDPYSSADLYNSGTDLSASGLSGDDTSLLNSLQSDPSQVSNANGGGLGPNDARPPSQGAMMALQVMPQLLGCLQAKCNPMGMMQSMLGPMLSQLGSFGGQAGGAIGGLMSQATSALQQVGGGQQLSGGQQAAAAAAAGAGDYDEDDQYDSQDVDTE